MKLSANHPHLPKGEELGISGLVVIPNGESVEVDDEAVALWEQDTGLKLEDALKNNAIISTGNEKPENKLKRLQKEQEERAEENKTEPEQLAEALEGGEG